MKKIMFNDRYGLTEAVLQGRKTMTRRVLKEDTALVEQFPKEYIIQRYAHCKVGEVVSIAQSYRDTGLFDVYEAPKETKGWNNKLFVKAEIMPHRIQITDVRLERMQDISEVDCLKEGIEVDEIGVASISTNNKKSVYPCEHSERVAFADLIEHISGRGTWEKNHYVFVYEFKLVK